jgi:mannose-1-phosphate guanylyltransferase / phosphomannomutase
MSRKTVALVLCLGAGSRMRPLSLACPKALLPFCGRPLLEYELEQFRQHQIKKVVIVIGPCDTGFDYFASWGRSQEMEILLLRRGLEFGSAGVVRHIVEVLDDYEQYLVIYGDSLFRINLTCLLEQHERRQTEGCEITLAYHTPEDLVIPGRDHTKYGIVSLDENARVIRFVEKPSVSEITNRQANSGVFVLNRRALDLLPARLPLDFSRDLFANQAVGLASPIFGFDVEDGYRFDIGTIGEYVRCQFAALDGLIPLEGVPWERLRGADYQSSTSVIGGKILVGTGCQFGKEIIFRGRNIIGSRVAIGDKAELSDCIILDGTTIGSGARISGAVLGSYCKISRDVTLREGTVLGDFSSVT